ncbi:MAG: glycosyltransferase family 4 protein [Bacteroides sp.]|nr:glycosyltransferase family 4 protein [Bacteroides sp.]MCM1548462.1 glycosyltransferase family 4 protein [Clostridium sp.]
MKIYIDVTNLLKVSFLTGIQRVVREVVLRLLRQEKQEIVLLSYNEGYHLYQKADTERFYSYFDQGLGERQEILTAEAVRMDDFRPNDIFFDIDSAWNLPLRRSVLLPRLKANGVKLAVYVYDVIPITHPQFCHEETLNNFMNYIGSYLQYADVIIASAQSTLDAIDALLGQLQLPAIPGFVSWLGSDFNVQETEAEAISPEAEQAAAAGPYILMVGTIEPRKNHALLLDAFDNQLFAQGMNLVFVGRTGWNVEALQNRIEKHPKLGKQFFHLKGMNDAAIDYLYRNAYCVAFPTFNEGFGLPIIEAFQRGTPVLASDIPILREVGGSYCAYFDCNSWKSFAETVRSWMEQPEQYKQYKEQIQHYVPVTWDQVVDNIWNALDSLITPYPYIVPEGVRQMVYLTARMEALLATLPFVEHFMPFIEEFVLCCPDSMVEQMEKNYTGRCQIRYITDSELLNGKKLPEDHTPRNFFLRCLAMEREELEDVFIMADDDYRPLVPITQEVFLKDGKYQGYYFYHFEDWKGAQTALTSFDHGMHRTRDFLKEHGYSTWMYEAHMPQIIDRRVFLELLEQHPGIEEKGLTEWSVYFNFLNTRYGGQVQNHPFLTMTWPGSVSDWDWKVFPERILFENYYEELYEPGELFEGFSKTYYDGIEQESLDKVVRFLNYQAEHNQARVMFQAYRANYKMLYGELPMFLLRILGEDCEIVLPEYVAVGETNFTRIPFLVEHSADADDTFLLSYAFLDFQGNRILEGRQMELSLPQEVIEVPVKGTFGGLKVILEISMNYRNKDYKAYTKLCVMRKGV